MSAYKKTDISRRSLKRKVLTQIDQAMAEAEQTHSVEDETIHTIRQKCKRIRAALRLLRKTAPRRSRRAAEHVRDAAAALSPLRDAQILPSAMKRVVAKAGRKAVLPVCQELADAINAHTAELIATVELPSALAIVTEQLQLARQVASEIKGCDRKALTAKVLLPMYRRGRESARSARGCGGEAFHQLRKDAKAHLEHCRLLRPRYKKEFADRVNRMRKLASLLGDAQDLAVLRVFLSKPCTDHLHQAEHEQYCDCCDELICELHKEAVLLAAELYADSPKRFAAALEALLR